MSHKHISHISEKQGNIFCTEQNPSKKHRGHRVAPAHNSRQFFQFFSKPHTFQYKKKTMIKPPEDKRYSSPMPHSGKEKYDKQVSIGACRAFAISSQRNIDIITKPGRQGNMPSVPEFLHRTSCIGIIEILLEFKSEHFSKTNGHIGISGKIVINLHHVKNCAQPQSLPGYRVWTIFKNFIHHTGKGIGKKNLFPKSPAKTHYPGCKFSDSLFSSCNLSCNVAIFYNRSCDQLWEKGNIQKHMPEIVLCRHLSPVHIDHIGQRLESIKRNSDRKRHLKKSGSCSIC